MARKKRTHGPETLQEAVEYVVTKLPEKDRELIAATEKDEFLVSAHFGLGMWMRNNLGLWAGGPLAKDLEENHDCFMADDMSDVILGALWERLQKRD